VLLSHTANCCGESGETRIIHGVPGYFLCEGTSVMCRNIKLLFNFDPPVTEEEIRAASLQYVRKISGFAKPSQANEAAFKTAVEEVAAASGRLLASMETNAPHRNREEEAAKAKARGMARYGT